MIQKREVSLDFWIHRNEFPFFFKKICSDDWTEGKWIEVDLQGRNRFPYAFIGPMAAAMHYANDFKIKPSTAVDDALKTMLVVESAWKDSVNMMPINYDG